MPISTRLTELLRVEHPILLAPMDVVADGKLAATVSEAGGFGIIGGGYGNEAWLTRELDAAGDARVGVGFITWSMAKNPQLLDLALEREPAAIMLSFGDVKPHADKIKRAGALMICQVQTVEQAKDAVANGADVLVAQGAEAGGHGVERGTFALVPAVVDAARGIPVAAASGDKTVRGILFDIARRNVWPAPYTGRVLRNEFSERWRGREAELMQHQADEAARYDKARNEGDFNTAAVIAGEGVDMISDIPPAREVVDRMIKEASALLAGSNRYRVA